MKACPFCAEQIQDAAIFCKHCRLDLPSAPVEAKSPNRSPVGIAAERADSSTRFSGEHPRRGIEKTPIIFAAIVVLVILLIAIGSSTQSDDSSSPPLGGRTQRQVDSIYALALRDSGSRLSRRGLFQMEERIHPKHIGIPHDSMHVQAIRVRLDSADRLLVPGKSGFGQVSPARAMLAALYEPLTAAQSSRRRALTQKAAHQDSIIQREARKLANQLMYRQRLDYAKKLESNFLDGGLDIEVSTAGPNATTLRLKYVLASRVFAHQMSQNGELWDGFRKMGFRRVDLTDGYDFSWYWTINP